jgi:hypothetical protein
MPMLFGLAPSLLLLGCVTLCVFGCSRSHLLAATVLEGCKGRPTQGPPVFDVVHEAASIPGSIIRRLAPLFKVQFAGEIA